jgi:hypothetical protein
LTNYMITLWIYRDGSRNPSILLVKWVGCQSLIALWWLQLASLLGSGGCLSGPNVVQLLLQQFTNGRNKLECLTLAGLLSHA